MFATHFQTRVRATYMRGGTSKGVFFVPEDLPKHVREDAVALDDFLLRVIGSPDPYRKQTDGMGGATSSTSKAVLVSKSKRGDCDVDYRFGQVSIESAFVDWSGNCGNLTAAVGPFAIARGLVDAPREGIARVIIWQVNLGKKIVAHVPMASGQVVELGDFRLDGVAFPAAEIRLEFLDPGGANGADEGMFPTGHLVDTLLVPGVGAIEASLVNAGNPTIFVDAAVLGLTGTELQADVNGNPELLARCEAVRAHGAVAMGIAASIADATSFHQHTPKLAFVAPAASYRSSSGAEVRAQDIDLLARILSMSVLHHAMTGTGAVALAAASAVPGTVPHRLLPARSKCGVRFGHPSGALNVEAKAEQTSAGWRVTQVAMSRSARQLMDGWVLVPQSLPT